MMISMTRDEMKNLLNQAYIENGSFFGDTEDDFTDGYLRCESDDDVPVVVLINMNNMEDSENDVDTISNLGGYSEVSYRLDQGSIEIGAYPAIYISEDIQDGNTDLLEYQISVEMTESLDAPYYVPLVKTVAIYEDDGQFSKGEKANACWNAMIEALELWKTNELPFI